MILGIGSDLVDIRRVERSLERFGDRFAARVFTPVERARADSCRHPAQRAASYAKRYAAKEAASKALGTGYDQGVHFKDIGVVNGENDRPTLALTGGALARLQAMTPPGMVAQIHLSMTDEPPLAQAFVVISAVPIP